MAAFVFDASSSALLGFGKAGLRVEGLYEGLYFARRLAVRLNGPEQHKVQNQVVLAK